MARKVFATVGNMRRSVELKETDSHGSSPLPEYGWKKNAVFRRFEGFTDKGEKIEVCIWEGTKKPEPKEQVEGKK